ncbi:glycoside hydrolase superfamily [Truncatella angustata]|uniref:Glycoside hydrolase superfamily n=1 Tax=Truncatella angustata TaxID=152316 RepID=A0A9P8UGT9_9PEZI|nr:glycoside hydrolase superfamily [Truncatella angustata]KAH6652072.1 glycoside hydrolase superfamily [Truncatella angustata]KAH8195766.1 hypothetical protein TruAng_010068 [Truncatella angustata]
MKVASLSLTALALLQLSAAEPNRRTVQQRYAHRRAFAPKRGQLTITDSSISSPTEVPEVVVYVNQFGKPIRTATEIVVIVPATTSSAILSSTLAYSTSVRASVVSAGTAAKPEATQDVSTPVAYATASSVSAPSSTPTKDSVSKDPQPSPSTATLAQPTSGDTNLHGITYSPYKGTGGCKSASEVDADFAVFAEDHGVVRLYGVDCNQVATAYAAAKKYGNKLFLGIFDISVVESAVSTIAAGVKNDWSIVDTVSVGNELVNNGAKTSAQVVAAINQARTALRSNGYQGPVVTVDTFVAAINHPELCNESDYCAVNVHPFFDPNTGADQAGSFVANQIKRIRSKLSDSSKRIVVTETGWPWKGEANGAAVPSLDNQAVAITSIQGSFSSNPADCIMFTAFNDPWKQADAGTFFAEQYWGMRGRYSAADR